MWRQCWEAPCQLGTSGYKSLLILNMWEWMCCVAASWLQVGCVILNRVQLHPHAPHKSCVKAQPHRKASMFLLISPSCTSLVSALQFLTGKLHVLTTLLHAIRGCSLFQGSQQQVSSHEDLVIFFEDGCPSLCNHWPLLPQTKGVQQRIATQDAWGMRMGVKGLAHSPRVV